MSTGRPQSKQTAPAGTARSLAELIAVAERAGITPADLDDEVHQLASTHAAAVNNAGMGDQIAFLVEALGAARTRTLLEAHAMHESLARPNAQPDPTAEASGKDTL